MDVTGTEEYQFTTSATPTLRLNSAVGSVHISSNVGEQIAVHVTKRAQDGLANRASERDLDAIHVTALQQGDIITIDARIERQHLLTAKLSVDLDIIVPTATRLDLHIAAGSLNIRGVHSSMQMEVAAGTSTLEGVTFTGSSRLTIDAGTLTLQGAMANDASLDVQINAGKAQITLPAATTATLDAEANAGSLHISGWPVRVNSSFATQHARGSFHPDQPATSHINIRVNAGSASLTAG